LNKSVLVTGATGTIGIAVCHKFAAANWQVLAHYNSSQDRADQLARQDQITLLRADLADVEGPHLLAKKVREAGQAPAVIVNSCAIFQRTPLEKITIDDWEKHLAINTRAPLFLIKELAAILQKNRGAVVNITDTGLQFPYPGFLAYMASKGALEAVTGALARALGPEVRVNAVAPGPVSFPENFGAEQQEKIIENTSLKRRGTPEEVAALIYFIATSAAYTTGTTVHIDGGYQPNLS
jgi:pteridine reductase